MHTINASTPHKSIAMARTFLTAGVLLMTSGFSVAPAWAGQSPTPSAALPPPARQTPTPGPVLLVSMERVVEMALEANLGLRADRLNLDSASHAVAAARAAFLPQVNSSLSRSSSRSVPQDFTQGASDITSQGVVVGTTFNQSLPVMGTRYGVSWNNTRNSQAGGNPLFNPFLQSSFAFNVTQPLWRGLTIDPNRASLETSRRRLAIADVELEQQVVRMESAVRNAYLDLISATEGLKVAEQNMEIRQAALANARARVKVGAAAPIDLLSAEAEVASNQEQVLLAKTEIETREDALRTLILDPKQPDFWQVHLVATDAIQPTSPNIDLDIAIRNALEHRLDVAVQRRDLEIQNLALEASRNATRPGVDLRVDYSTSGTGGTRFAYGAGFPPPVVNRTDKGFGSVLGDTFGAVYPRWSAALTVSYPLGRSATDAAYAQQEVGLRQGEIALRELEIAVVQQVREAARRVETSYQRVLVNQTALRASEQQLDAEGRRFTAGLSTMLELQVRQGQLGTARTAELNAVIAYHRALIDFERVQRTQ